MMKKTYIDNIKWITVVLVVIYHVIYMYNGVEVYGVIGPFKEIQYQDIFQYIVYPWFMLLLFVVSGMCARFDIVKHTHKDFMKKRTRRYLVPSTIGLFVFGWVLGYYNMAMGGAIDSFSVVPKPIVFLIMCVSGCGPLWYIQLLWVYSVVLVLVVKLEKDKLYNVTKKCPAVAVAAYALVIWGAAQILNTPVVSVYRFGIYGAGFFFGYFVLSHDEVMDKIGKKWYIFTVLAIVFCTLFTVMYWQQPYAEAVVLETFMCNMFAWFGTLGVLAFMKRWGNFENSFSIFMSKKSWGLYLFHYLPIAMVAYYLSKVSAPAIICYLLCAIASFAGSYLLYEVFSRIPFLRWCICGIGGKKK